MFIKLFKLNKRKNSEYYLSEILINASQIVYMSEDYGAVTLMKEGKINLGLHNATTFTKIRMKGANHVEEITVVGDPSLIEHKIFNKSKKQLLRD